MKKEVQMNGDEKKRGKKISYMVVVARVQVFDVCVCGWWGGGGGGEDQCE